MSFWFCLEYNLILWIIKEQERTLEIILPNIFSYIDDEIQVHNFNFILRNKCLIQYFTNPKTIIYSFFFLVLLLSILGIQSLNRCPITAWPGPKTELQVATHKRPSNVISTISLYLSLAQNKPPSEYLRHQANVLSHAE